MVAVCRTRINATQNRQEEEAGRKAEEIEQATWSQIREGSKELDSTGRLASEYAPALLSLRRLELSLHFVAALVVGL